MRFCSRSVPWVRAVATSRARPALASHAENARRSIGEAEYPVVFSWSVHRDNAIKRESIIPSRQSRAERRWVRWNAKPARPSVKADEKAKWMGVIR